MLLSKSHQNSKFSILFIVLFLAVTNSVSSQAQNSVVIETDLTNYVSGMEPVNIRTGGFLSDSQIFELAENGLPLTVKFQDDYTAVDLLIEVCGDLNSNADYFSDLVVNLNSLSSIEEKVTAPDEILIPFCPYNKFDKVEVKNGDTLSEIYIDYYSKNLPADYSNKAARRSLLNFNLNTLKVIAEINNLSNSGSEAQPKYPLKIGFEIQLPAFSSQDRWFIAKDIESYNFERDFDRIILREDNLNEELAEISKFSYVDPSDFLVSTSGNKKLAWVPNAKYFGSMPKNIENENIEFIEPVFLEALKQREDAVEKTKSQIENLRKKLKVVEIRARNSRKLKSFGLVRELGGSAERAEIRSLHSQITQKEKELKDNREAYETLSQYASSVSQKTKILIQKNDTPIGLANLCQNVTTDIDCKREKFIEPKVDEIRELRALSSVMAAVSVLESIEALNTNKSPVRLASKITSERGNSNYVASLSIESVESEEFKKYHTQEVQKGVFEHLSSIENNGECKGYKSKTIPDMNNFLELFTRQVDFAKRKYGGSLSHTIVGLIDTGIGIPIEGEVWNIQANEMFSEKVLSKNDNQSRSMSQDFDNSIPGDVYGISLTGCEHNCSKDNKHNKYGHLGYHKTQFYKGRYKHGTNVASLMLGGKGFISSLGYEPIQLTSVNVTNRANSGFVGSKGIVEGIEYFTNSARGRIPKPRIINISYKTKDESEKYEKADYFPEDHLFVVAAGQNLRDGSDIDDESEEVWPGNLGGKRGFHNVITVGASTAKEDLSLPRWANYGEGSVDLFAPGCNVEVYSPGYSTRERSSPPIYETASGSSMATPQVTFGASLISYLSNNRLTPRQIKNRILATVDFHEDYSSKSSTGGIFNIEKSINIYSDLVVKADGTKVLGILDETTERQLISFCIPSKKGKLEKSRLKKILIKPSEAIFWRSTFDHEYNYKPIVCQGVGLDEKIKILDDETGNILNIPMKEVIEIIPRELNRN